MSAQAIEDSVLVGGRTGGLGGKALAGRAVTLKTPAGFETVAGTSANWYLDMPRSLSWAIDDVTRDFGSDLYARMMLDPQIQSVCNVLKSACLNREMELRPAIDDTEADGYSKAKQYVNDAEGMFEELETSIDDVLWDMMDAMPYGNRAAELVFDLEKTYSGKTQYQLTRMVPKPYDCIAYIVDAYNRTLAIAGRLPGNPFPPIPSTMYLDLEKEPNILPRSKFAVYSFRPKNADPRGTSIIRSCFDAWNTKVALKADFVRYLSQFATPSLIGYTQDGAESYPLLGSDGQPMIDPDTGEPRMVKPEQDMIDALTAFANGTVTAFPFGSSVDVVQVMGEGAAYINGLARCDHEIAKGVLGQTLATEEGEHQARSASSTHKDILDDLVRVTKRPLERMLRRDVLGTWMKLNGRSQDMMLRPKVRLGRAAQEDLTRLMGAISSLAAVGVIHPSQLTGVDDLLELPKRARPEFYVPAKEGIQVMGNEGDVEPVGGAVRANPPAQAGNNPGTANTPRAAQQQSTPPPRDAVAAPGQGKTAPRP